MLGYNIGCKQFPQPAFGDLEIPSVSLKHLFYKVTKHTTEMKRDLIAGIAPLVPRHPAKEGYLVMDISTAGLAD